MTNTPCDLDEVRTLIDKTECACAEQRLCGWHYEYRVEVLAAAIRLADEADRLRKDSDEYAKAHAEDDRENTRLTRELEAANAKTKGYDERIERLLADLAEVRREVERLRSDSDGRMFRNRALTKELETAIDRAKWAQEELEAEREVSRGLRTASEELAACAALDAK